jgi:hypothetical protein
MKTARVVALVVPLAITGAGAFAFLSYRSATKEAEAAWREIAATSEKATPRFDASLVADLPEVARRYFNHAIAPGTQLHTTVALEMRGIFLLGDKARPQPYEMTARQILSPPNAFVWIPQMRSGAIRISGSDGLVRGRAWTRFWLLGLVPVANEAASPDLVRSATFRSTMEGIWAPASLLPQRGVKWEQIGPDTARVTVESVSPAIVLHLTLGADGAVREAIGQRWSNANPQKAFRLQPFGGTVEAERSFGGFTIPSRLRIGNHYGTDDYLPFFQAEVTNARYF